MRTRAALWLLVGLGGGAALSAYAFMQRDDRMLSAGYSLLAVGAICGIAFATIAKRRL